MKKLSLMMAAVLLLAGCHGKGSKANLLPNVSGKAGEIVVVIDRDAWEGGVGSSLREILAGECPYLAQREPLFTLSNVPPANFNNMFKVHRNIIILNVDPQLVKEGMVYRQDKWARPQSVAQINAYDLDGAVRIIKENEEILPEYFEQAERNRIIANAILYEESSVVAPVKDLTGGAMHFPTGYQLKKVTEDFLWISDEKQYVDHYVMIYRYPVPDGDPFSEEAAVAKRNEVMKANVPGMFENTYMTTSAAFPITTTFKKYHGIDFLEMRGMWEVYNDFMGGPFVSHAFYSKDGKDILVIEGSVYAPKFDKRKLLREVESLLYSFEWTK